MSSLRWPPAPLPDHDGYQAAPADPGTGPGGATPIEQMIRVDGL